MAEAPTPGAAGLTVSELAQRLIRNFNSVPLETWERPPPYTDQDANLGAGTAARKMACGFDSDKLMASASQGGQNTLRSMHHRATAVDCWEGEA